MDNEILIERLGQLIDTIDNYAEYSKPGSVFPAAIRLDAMTSGLLSIREEVFEIYTELGGTDEWSED